jgi:hypothetical protein
LVVFKDVDWDPDKAGAGIWGGIYLIIFALLLILKKSFSSYIVYPNMLTKLFAHLG